MLEAAVAAGLASAGADVLRVGVLPTPAVAFLTDSYGADLGVVLSASHNPMPDNGVKLFARGGRKLPDDIEDEIEQAVEDGAGGAPDRRRGRTDSRRGRRRRALPAAPERGRAASRWPGCTSSSTAPTVPPRPSRLSCTGGPAPGSPAIAADPDGLNINEGVGSTHLEQVMAAVLAHGADLGIAHDGDADRSLAVDASGTVVDGDQILGAVRARRCATPAPCATTPSSPPS